MWWALRSMFMDSKTVVQTSRDNGGFTVCLQPCMVIIWMGKDHLSTKSWVTYLPFSQKHFFCVPIEMDGSSRRGMLRQGLKRGWNIRLNRSTVLYVPWTWTPSSSLLKSLSQWWGDEYCILCVRACVRVSERASERGRMFSLQPWQGCFSCRFLGECRVSLRDVLNSPNLSGSFTVSLLDTKKNNTGVSSHRPGTYTLLNHREHSCSLPCTITTSPEAAGHKQTEE